MPFILGSVWGQTHGFGCWGCAAAGRGRLGTALCHHCSSEGSPGNFLFFQWCNSSKKKAWLGQQHTTRGQGIAGNSAAAGNAMARASPCPAAKDTWRWKKEGRVWHCVSGGQKPQRFHQNCRKGWREVVLMVWNIKDTQHNIACVQLNSCTTQLAELDKRAEKHSAVSFIHSVQSWNCFCWKKPLKVMKSTLRALMLFAQSHWHHNLTSISCTSQPELGELQLPLIHAADGNPFSVPNKNPTPCCEGQTQAQLLWVYDFSAIVSYPVSGCIRKSTHK